jgi:hypothetical protein
MLSDPASGDGQHRNRNGIIVEPVCAWAAFRGSALRIFGPGGRRAYPGLHACLVPTPSCAAHPRGGASSGFDWLLMRGSALRPGINVNETLAAWLPKRGARDSEKRGSAS